MTRDMTLSQTLWASNSFLRNMALVLGGTLLIALSAQISVPFFPVPLTLQTFAILLVGLTYGARLGTVTVVTYLAQGAVELPVFAGGAAGLATLMGPTGGFLFGFVIMAFVAGWCADRGLSRGFVTAILSALLASAVVYIPGVTWLFAITPLDLNGAISGGMLPFLLGDALKSVIAGLIVTGAWTVLKARQH